jgi:predicted ATPase
VNVSGIPAFRPLYDALHHMGFYNLNPDAIRELQPPDPGDILAPDGRNLASVLKRIMEHDESVHARVMKLLADVVPGVTGVEHLPLGNKESFEFRQVVGSNPTPWRFPADNMSDGTLRALGVLVALFQPPISADKSVPLVGIEEPESALHPGAAAVLRTALREAAQRKQLLITSHSPDLLDDKEIPQESIYAVTNRAGETLISPLDETSRSALHDRLFTAGELLRLNQLEADEGYVERLPATQLELFKTD